MELLQALRKTSDRGIEQPKRWKTFKNSLDQNKEENQTNSK